MTERHGLRHRFLQRAQPRRPPRRPHHQQYAVVGFGETLRMELEQEGIGVSILFPASMSTRHLESSRLARPAQLGPSLLRNEDVAAMLASRDMDDTTNVVTPEFAVRNLLDDLARNEPYIVTHGGYRDALVRRQQAFVATYDRMTGSNDVTEPAR